MKWCRHCQDPLADDHRGPFCKPCQDYFGTQSRSFKRTLVRRCQGCGLIMALDTLGVFCDACFRCQNGIRGRRFNRLGRDLEPVR